MQRVLTCECGKGIIVSPAQAGQQVRCEGCGSEIRVPTLRGLAELPPARQGHGDLLPSAGAAWRWRGPLMALGLTGLLASLVISGYFFRIWYLVDNRIQITGPEIAFTIDSADSDIRMQHAMLDSAGPDQLSYVWDRLASSSLQQSSPPIYKLLGDYSARRLHGLLALTVA